jgi:quercetin dioxygenase-like cupin family protein
MNAHRIDFTSQEWETPAPHVRMKVYKGYNKQLRLVEFSQDFIEPDWCMNGHVGYILDGRMELDFNGTVETFKQGDGLFIPPGPKHKHKARMLTKTVTLILVETITEREEEG